MRLANHPQATAAVLLVGLAALHALLGAAGGGPQGALRATAAPHPLPPVGSSRRKDLDWCLQNVSIIHDVYWASACAVAAREQRARRNACLARRTGAEGACAMEAEPPDDSTDCTLPEQRAGELNAARARAEQQCLEDAGAR